MDNKEKQILTFVKNKLEMILDTLFVEAHNEFKTKSGDISPEDSFRYEVLVEELAKLMTKQVKENL
jgi:hypothetical protein